MELCVRAHVRAVSTRDCGAPSRPPMPPASGDSGRAASWARPTRESVRALCPWKWGWGIKRRATRGARLCFFLLSRDKIRVRVRVRGRG